MGNLWHSGDLVCAEWIGPIRSANDRAKRSDCHCPICHPRVSSALPAAVVAFPAIRLEKAALAEARGFNCGWMCPVIFTRTWRSGQGEDRLNEPHKAHYVKSRAGGHASAV